MSKKYIIGIDGGTQSTKIVIFDTDGNIVSQASENLKSMIALNEGYAQHPDDDLWTSLTVSSKKAIANFDGNLSDIVGVGLCTIRCCKTYMKDDGTLAEPAMSWMDIRAYQPYENTNAEIKYAAPTTGYMTYRLTGNFNDTIANCYQGQWPIDLDTWAWSQDPEVYKKFNFPKNMLPNIQMPGSILGYVTKEASMATSIPVGTPVIATASDKAVEALGAGLLSDNLALLSLGTYIASMVAGHENLSDTKECWTNFASIPHKYIYESAGVRRGMWTVSWFRDLLGDGIINKAKDLNLSSEQYLDKLAEDVPAGCYGLMTLLDWLAPVDKPFKRGVMIGFNEKHKSEHIFRSILEAIALTMKNNAEAMFNELNRKPNKVIVSGGGSNSAVFMQIFADTLNIPTSRNVVNSSASMGAAINVAVGLGIYNSYEEAVSKMIRVRDTFYPISKNVEMYQKMNEVYKDISIHTDEVLKQSHKIF